MSKAQLYNGWIAGLDDADKLSPFLPELPAHHYGVHVASDMDARRLLYLVEQIGSDKIICSAYKYSQRYPGSRIFVSKLLGRFGVKVPARVFASVNVPVYRVYVLVHTPSGKLKVCVSGSWVVRCFAFSDNHSMNGFDLDRSIAITFNGRKKTAFEAEKTVKNRFRDAITSPPKFVLYGAGGHKEWFNVEIYDEVVGFISFFDTPTARNAMTLRYAMKVGTLLDELDDTPKRGYQ